MITVRGLERLGYDMVNSVEISSRRFTEVMRVTVSVDVTSLPAKTLLFRDGSGMHFGSTQPVKLSKIWYCLEVDCSDVEFRIGGARRDYVGEDPRAG